MALALAATTSAFASAFGPAAHVEIHVRFMGDRQPVAARHHVTKAPCGLRILSLEFYAHPPNLGAA